MSPRLYSKKMAGKEPYFLFIVYFAWFWQGGQWGQWANKGPGMSEITLGAAEVWARNGSGKLFSKTHPSFPSATKLTCWLRTKNKQTNKSHKNLHNSKNKDPLMEKKNGGMSLGLQVNSRWLNKGKCQIVCPALGHHCPSDASKARGELHSPPKLVPEGLFTHTPLQKKLQVQQTFKRPDNEGFSGEEGGGLG